MQESEIQMQTLLSSMKKTALALSWLRFGTWKKIVQAGSIRSNVGPLAQCDTAFWHEDLVVSERTTAER